MKNRQNLSAALVALVAIASLSSFVGCGGGAEEETVAAKKPAISPTTPGAASGISPQKFADAVHAVMMADRTVYARHVVTRLKSQEAPVSPSEYWEDEDHTIPLPAQMFRMGAELVDKNDKAGFTYALKSKWPLNAQNKAKTPVEIEGLDYVAANPEKNFYGEEKIGDTTFFTAVYGDRAVAEACWSCHNDHANRGDDYPEFKKDDVMGGVIVRVPVN